MLILLVPAGLILLIVSAICGLAGAEMYPAGRGRHFAGIFFAIVAAILIIIGTR